MLLRDAGAEAPAYYSYSLLDKYLSASSAAMQPVPVAVTA